VGSWRSGDRTGISQMGRTSALLITREDSGVGGPVRDVLGPVLETRLSKREQNANSRNDNEN